MGLKNTVLSIFLIFFSFTIIAQNKIEAEKIINRRCATNEYMLRRQSIDTAWISKRKEIEDFSQNYIKNNTDKLNKKEIITIPVVVHIIYKYVSQNVTDERVLEQIGVLNRDYMGLNTHSMGAFADSLKTNTQLQFCLAKRTPSGAWTSGIERRTGSDVPPTFYVNDDMKYYSLGGLDQWDPNKYMNIWVCDIYNSGTSGFAEFPTKPLYDTYGVVISPQFFGITGATPPYDLGATTTHEIGHCFNLYHIWGDDDGDCGGTIHPGSDLCSDTPDQSDANFDPHTGAIMDACSPNYPGIMYMNFMDYTHDKCLANFTPKQKLRIQACFATNGVLAALKNSNACTPVAVDENQPIIECNIYPNPSDGNVNLNINLNQTDNISIITYNMIGDIIAEKIILNADNVDITLDLTAYPAGIYFVKIQSDSQSITKKLSLIK